MHQPHPANEALAVHAQTIRPVEADERPMDLIGAIAAVPTDPETRVTRDPADIAHDCTHHAQAAAAGIESYIVINDGMEHDRMDGVLTSLLADLMHVCDAVHLDFERILPRAITRYTEEATGQV